MRTLGFAIGNSLSYKKVNNIKRARLRTLDHLSVEKIQ